MNFNRFTIVVGSLVGMAFVASAFASSDFNAEVSKSDGSKTIYRLLPVHHDPAHASLVAQRLQANRHLETTLKLPKTHQIAKTALPAIRDQGYRGTCAYFATVGLMEQYFMTKTTGNKSLRLSEECLVDVRNWEADTADYKAADKPEQRPDDAGDLPGSIIQTVKMFGVPTAKDLGHVSCVYNLGDIFGKQGLDITLDQYTATMSSTPTATESLPYGKGLTWDQNTAPTITALKTLISKDIPVEVGIVVYNSYMGDGVSDWRYTAAADASGIAGGHAIILTGYTTSSTGATVFTFKNSWGTTWGKSGFGTMDDKVLTKSWSYDPNFDAITSLHPATAHLN